VVLSSYFTQRGEPALLSKWDRAESAIRAGANLVLELPVFFSCHNAGVFAAGAVDILAATGLVRSLSFGMEEPGFDVSPLLDIVVHEPATFKDTLKKYLNSGFSYVKARAKALESIKPEYGGFLSSPNNALALSYMEHVTRKAYDISFVPIQRRGSGYHDQSLAGSFSGASAIRRALAEGSRTEAEKALPSSTGAILKRCLEEGRYVLSKDFLWRIARTLLLRTTAQTLALSSEMSEGMENRLLRFAPQSISWDDFIGKCVSARYPRGRIQRQTTHFLLGIKHEENRELQKSGPAYIHPLAADEAGIGMLRTMRKTALLPVTGKLPLLMQGAGGRLAALEMTAAALWENLNPFFRPDSEKKRFLFTTTSCAEAENVPADAGKRREEPFRERPHRTGRFP
jgi:predicted nucleotidyltransferase